MHRKYKDKGLVAMSVTVDPAESKPDALKFLQAKGATFANYWLDDPESKYMDKWDVGGPPVIFVFDRLGRRAAKFVGDDPDKPYTAEDVDKVVEKLLEEKAPGETTGTE